MRTRFKITLGMLTPFDYACKREDKEAIRNFSVLIVEQSETVDWLVDELIYVLSHVSHHDAKLYAELRDSTMRSGMSGRALCNSFAIPKKKNSPFSREGLIIVTNSRVLLSVRKDASSMIGGRTVASIPSRSR